MNSVTNILSNLAMNRILAFNELVIIKFAKCLARGFVSVYAGIKKFIIDAFTNLQRINNPFLLFARRIQPELIHQQAHKRVEYVNA